MKAAVFSIVAAALLVAPAAAQAQLASKGGPIAYSADNLEYQDDNRIMILTGNVDLTQSCARLQANKLTLYFLPSVGGKAATGFSSGDIDHIVAEGDVHYVRPDQKARGDNAVYNTKADTVTFTGNVVVSNADNVIRGETLVLQVGSGRTTLAPAPKPGDRVRGVFHPKQDQTAAEKPKQPVAATGGC